MKTKTWLTENKIIYRIAKCNRLDTRLMAFSIIMMTLIVRFRFGCNHICRQLLIERDIKHCEMENS